MNLINIILLIIIVSSAGAKSKKKELQKAATQLLEKEGSKYDIALCKNTQPANVHKLRFGNKTDAAISCVLKSLSTANLNGWNWSYLGSLYTGKGEKAKATTCFKQAAKLNGKVSEYIRQWHFIGPFVIGKIEVDGDPVEFWGGIVSASSQRYDRKAVYYSELVPGGQVKWKAYPQNRAEERIQVVPDVNWNELISSLGSVAISEWQGWVVGEFAVNAKGDVSLQCLGVHTVFVDGIFIAADVYRRENFWYTLTLDAGIHTMYIRLRAKGNQVFQCNIKSSDGETFVVHPPTMLPDMVEGSLMGEVFALPITNLQGNKWLKNIRVSLVDEASDVIVSQDKDQVHFQIAPGQNTFIIVRVELNKEHDAEGNTQEDKIAECKDIRFKIKVSASSVKGSQTIPVTLRCRKRHESFLFSFLDHDGSVQQAAAIEPLEDCSGGLCPVLLTLHGTGVSAQNQADSYKRLEGDQWLFGLERAWVLAPTRHGAHNWEGPGTLTSMTALEKLQELVSGLPWQHNNPLPDGVIFAGHSMGGHGAWHLVTHYPDRALAAVSLAGWIKKEEYGDSNIFFRHDISTSHTDPAIKQILEACIAENDADRHISNIQHVPVLTRIGASDRTVHPFFVRRMNRLLKEQGTNVTYSEIAGKEHWWWDTWKTNDGGAVNDPKLRDFANSHATLPPSLLPHLAETQSCDAGRDDAHCSTPHADRYSGTASGDQDGVGEFTLTVMNPALGEGLRGVRVIQQIVPFRTSTIKMTFKEDSATLVTRNVARFSITEPHHLSHSWRLVRSLQVDKINLQLEGLELSKSEESIHFCLTEDGSWEVCVGAIGLGERDSATYGPARRVAEQRFIIVTGTQQDELETSLLQMAVYLANLFFLTSDTVAMVTEDASLTADVAAQHNLIVIGGPSQNSWAQHFVDGVPIGIDNDGLSLGRCHFSDPQTGALFLAPHGNGHLALVLLGNSIHGLEDVMRLASPTIPPMTRSPFSNLVPDYIITGRDFRSKGPGGYECIGFWGNRWDYRLETSSCIC